MSELITHALSIAIDAKAPPKELRLFRVGVNRSLKGAFVFDEKAARDVMANYEAMGHSLTIDYDHGSIRKDAIDPSQSGKSAGRFDLALRDGELWAVNIRWSPAADAAIRREEWPFISPTFTSDENQRVVLVLNFGLTGNPALLDPPRLIAANQATETQQADPGKGRTTDTEKTMKWNALNDYMKQKGCAKPVMAACLGLAVEALDALMVGDGDMTAEQEAAATKCQAMSLTTLAPTPDAVSLSAVAVLSGRPGASRDDALARVGELQTASVQLLSVTSCTTLTDAIKRVQTLSATFGELVKASGAADEAQAVAKLRELCGKQAEIEAGAIKAKEVRVLNLLTAAKAENKITPAEIGGARGLQAMGMKDEDWLADHLKARSPITALSADEEHEGPIDTGVTVGAVIAGVVEKDGVVTLNGLPYEKLGGDTKHNLAASDAPADKRAFKALRANWEKRGAPVVA